MRQKKVLWALFSQADDFNRLKKISAAFKRLYVGEVVPFLPSQNIPLPLILNSYIAIGRARLQLANKFVKGFGFLHCAEPSFKKWRFCFFTIPDNHSVSSPILRGSTQSRSMFREHSLVKCFTSPSAYTLFLSHASNNHFIEFSFCCLFRLLP